MIPESSSMNPVYPSTPGSISLFVDDTKEAGSSLESPLFALQPSQPVYLGLIPEARGIRGRGYTGCISDLVIRDK